MFSRRAIREPGAGRFQIAVRTAFPCQGTSAGIPTFTDNNEAIEVSPFHVTSCMSSSGTGAGGG
jgi:hypothetical protein